MNNTTLDRMRYMISECFMDNSHSSSIDRFDTAKTGIYRASVPLPANAFELARIGRAVYCLPDFERNWILFAYTDLNQPDVKEDLIKQAWRQFEDGAAIEQLRNGKKQRLQILNYFSIHIAKNIVNRHPPGVTVAAVCKTLKMNSGNFTRDFGDYWELMLNKLRRTDKIALLTVRENFKKETGTNE